jgi:fluoroquinolone transport system permease protein
VKALVQVFALLLRQIRRDRMLGVVCVAPLLAAGFFRFGLPAIEQALCAWQQWDSLLAPYYRLFDLVLALLTPYLFCFVSAMVILDETDEHLPAYLAVTPVGKGGYLAARLVIPAVLACCLSLLLLGLFALTVWSFGDMILIVILSGLLSVLVCLLLVACSRNRVEGMALGKLSGLIMLGLPVPFWLQTPVQYLFAPLPSYWIARLGRSDSLLLIIPTLLTLLAWFIPLYRAFLRKVS